MKSIHVDDPRRTSVDEPTKAARMTYGKVFEGDLVAEAGKVYAYERITGSLDASGADTKTAFPRLTSVGGYLYASGDFSHVKTNDTTAIQKCRALLLSSFAAAGFSFADGILARIVSRRGPVSRVIICGKTDVTFIITDGDVHSHGKTLKEARDGLLYKIRNHDTSEFKAWNLNTVVTKRDAIRAYRSITGACELGVRMWMEKGERPEKITVQGVIDLTAGAYGCDVFKEFFSDRKE